MYDSYGHDRHLFNMLSRTSAAFFAWEQGFEDVGPSHRLITLDNIEDFRRLTAEGREILELPFAAFGSAVIKLPSAEAVYGSVDTLAFVCMLRYTQWRKYYRGRTEGINVKFKSDLNPKEDLDFGLNVSLLKKALLKEAI